MDRDRGDYHKINTLWYSGEDKYYEKGVGFLVQKDIAKSVMECRPISSSIITMRLAGQPSKSL